MSKIKIESDVEVKSSQRHLATSKPQPTDNDETKDRKPDIDPKVLPKAEEEQDELEEELQDDGVPMNANSHAQESEVKAESPGVGENSNTVEDPFSAILQELQDERDSQRRNADAQSRETSPPGILTNETGSSVTEVDENSQMEIDLPPDNVDDQGASIIASTSGSSKQNSERDRQRTTTPGELRRSRRQPTQPLSGPSCLSDAGKASMKRKRTFAHVELSSESEDGFEIVDSDEDDEELEEQQRRELRSSSRDEGSEVETLADTAIAQRVRRSGASRRRGHRSSARGAAKAERSKKPKVYQKQLDIDALKLEHPGLARPPNPNFNPMSPSTYDFGLDPPLNPLVKSARPFLRKHILGGAQITLNYPNTDNRPLDNYRIALYVDRNLGSGVPGEPIVWICSGGCLLTTRTPQPTSIWKYQKGGSRDDSANVWRYMGLYRLAWQGLCTSQDWDRAPRADKDRLVSALDAYVGHKEGQLRYWNFPSFEGNSREQRVRKIEQVLREGKCTARFGIYTYVGGEHGGVSERRELALCKAKRRKG